MAGHSHISKSQRLMIIISISFTFFVVEIAVGFYTKSLALVADAFHYLNDLVGFIVALVAIKVSERSSAPKELSFGWQRANLLGAFFNGVFLLALGVSIFLQSIERFIDLKTVENPLLVLIIGCVGLALNIISASFLHEHDHGGDTAIRAELMVEEGNEPKANGRTEHSDHRHETNPDTNKKDHRDFGMMGVLIHVIGDAANNVGVIIAASIIWKVESQAKYYADPAVSMFIAFMIFFTSLPLVRKTGEILIEISPVDPHNVQHDIEQIPGVKSVHELHIWRLNQQKSIASTHIVVSDQLLSDFMKISRTVTECLHAYGVHSSTIQPELAVEDVSTSAAETRDTEEQPIREGMRQRATATSGCRIGCGFSGCEDLTCCN